MSEVGALSRPRRAPYAELVEQNGDCLTLLSKQTRKKVRLEGIAAVIWELCDGNNTFDQIAELFAQAYPDSTEVEDDIKALIEDLQSQKLLLLDGGESSLEYQGGVVRKLTPTVELQWHLEQIRQFLFAILRVPDLDGLDSDLEALLGDNALKAAKESDADSASHSDSTVIPYSGALKSPSMAAVMNNAIVELKNMLPEVEAPMEMSGNAIYLRGSHMGWHSNHSRTDGRVYCSWAESADSNFFRYEDPLTGEIVTEWEEPGWNIKSFTIPPPNARFWHCIGAGSLRLSIGFRYNLPETKEPTEAPD